MQQYSPTYQPNIQQGHHRSWGEVTRLHHDIQKQREEYERALEKERQAKYKEELDKLMMGQKDEKVRQRRMEEETRLKFEREQQEYRERELAARIKAREVKSSIADDGLRDYHMKLEREKQVKEMENLTHQQRLRTLAEQERLDREHLKEEKNAISKHLQKEYAIEHEYKLMNSGKEKEKDREYIQNYGKVLDNQEANRRQFFDKIRNNQHQNDFATEHYDKIILNENQRKKEYEYQSLERARYEKSRKEEEEYIRKEMIKNQMKSQTFHTLQNQMLSKKENERVQRQREIELEEQQLKKTMEDFDRKQRERKEFENRIKNENVQVLNKQLEELQSRKKQEDWLTPLEEKINQKDINILDKKNDSPERIAIPSFIPGRTLAFERKLQNQYINKALNVNSPGMEIVRHSRSPISNEIGYVPTVQSNRSYLEKTYSVQPQSNDPQPPLSYPRSEYPSQPIDTSDKYSQNIDTREAEQSYNQPVQYQRNRNRIDARPLQIQENQYNNFGNPSSTPQQGIMQYSQSNQIYSPAPRVENTFSKITNDIYRGGVSQSVQELRVLADAQPGRRDYLQARNRNGPQSNPFNIISNEVKGPSLASQGISRPY